MILVACGGPGLADDASVPDARDASARDAPSSRPDALRLDAGPPPPPCADVPVAEWDLATGRWSTSFGTHGVSGGDATAVIDLRWHADALYVGGSFTHAGPIPARNVAAWSEAEGWRALGEGVPDEVWAITTAEDGRVYAATGHLGGVFVYASGAWTRIGSGTGSVHALAIDADGTLLAGGDVRDVDGLRVDGLARWDGSAWSAVPYPGRTVDAIWADAWGVCIGGRATSPAGYVACRGPGEPDWTVHAIRPQPGPPYPRPVTSITRSNSGELLVGGNFVLGASRLDAGGVYRWSGSGWETVGPGLSATSVDWVVSGIASTTDFRTGEPVIWAVGFLLGWIGPPHSSIDLLGVGRFQGGRWLSPGYIEGMVGSLDVHHVVSNPSGTVFVAGALDQVHGQGDEVLAPHGIVRHSAGVWSMLEHPGDPAHGTGSAWPITGRGACGPYVVPQRQIVEDRLHGGVGVLDAEGRLSPARLGAFLSDPPHALAVAEDGTLYAGGWMDHDARGHAPLMQLGARDWAPIGPLGGTGWPASDHSVYTLAIAPDGSLVVGGRFEDEDEPSRSHLARWTGSEWLAIGEREPLTVYETLVRGDELYVVERLDPRLDEYRVSRWDGSRWQVLGATMRGSIGGLAWHRGSLVAAMNSYDEGVSVRRWTGSEWSLVGRAWGELSSSTWVSALAVLGDTLVVGGTLPGPEPGSLVGAAYLAGDEWRSLDIGPRVADVLASPRGLYFVGEFELAGGRPSWGIAQLSPP